MVFDREILRVDPEKEVDRICEFIQTQVFSKFKRKGAVVGLSGGVDSALLACLCVRALSREKVLGVLLPETESSPQSAVFAAEQADSLGIDVEVVDVTPMIKAFEAYERRNRIIRQLCPDFDPDTDKVKIVLPPDLLHQDALNIFSLIVDKASGKSLNFRLRTGQIRAISSAQNIKQRVRMIQLYAFAEESHYVVCGTTNRTEMDQGFFVKFGDGGVDIEPVAHLYKTQIFHLAEHMGVTKNIQERTPSPDTWPGGVTDEEFYFRMPFHELDLLLYAWNEGVSADAVCKTLNLDLGQVDRAFRDFQSKRDATWHLRESPPSLG